MKRVYHLYISILFSASLIVIHTVTFAQVGNTPSGRQYRLSAVMNGNQVRTVFGNWGVIAQPIDTRPRGAWKDDNNGYLGDVSPFIGAEVKWTDTTFHPALDTVFHSVVTCPVSRPTVAPDESPTGLPWTFEPENGYAATSPNQSIALSNDPTTWPTFWPDKLDDATDPGWRGSWNGYFGKRASADLETYFVMDDNDDQRFNYAVNNPRRIAFKPDSTNPNRNGLGLVVTVRALQWAQFLAQDNIFWLYEINNQSTTTYDRMVFGMLVGTYVGVTGSDNGPMEYNNDWSFFDVRNNITYSGNFPEQSMRNPRWNMNYPPGLIGYAFLETPGNPYDGIDNDGDADSSLVGQAAPQFTSADFDSTVIQPNSNIVLISDDYSRHIFNVGSQPVKVITRGMKDSVLIVPGITKVVEGNVLTNSSGSTFVNPNAYDGIDNNFNGLIDENYFLHYHEIKKQPNPSLPPLIDILRPLRHINYLTLVGTSPYSMIDEKRNDCIDNNLDWNIAFDDVGRDGIGPGASNYPGPDYGEGDGTPTSGYDCSKNPPLDTGEPGEPHIDKTDPRESDQIGLSSFYYFTNATDPINLSNDQSLWVDLEPGFFDVPNTIINNQPVAGEDGDFVYGSGYFPLVAGTTERFTLGLVYGGGKKGNNTQDDINDLLKNKQTVQKIYDANYQFPTPPPPPVVTAVAGDHQVTLYWDRSSESYIDPVLRTKDFEGYKIYKSTDPNFSDIFTITDASGTPRGYVPIVQYDKKDGVQGYFQATGDLYQDASGFSYYLGNESGLQHSYVDKEVDNGRKYYYAVVAYTTGNSVVGIFPAENTHSIRLSSTGLVSSKDINVVVVTPNAPTAGYVAPPNGVGLFHTTGTGSGGINYAVMDATKLTGSHYQVSFLDTQIDGIDNNSNGLIDASDSTEWDRRTSFYSVRNLDNQTETFMGDDTSRVSLSRKNLIGSTVTVRNSHGGIVSPAAYSLDSARGVIKGTIAGSLPTGKYTITYQYYPVFQSQNIQGTPFLVENTEADIFDGVQLSFDNVWNVALNTSSSGWKGQNPYIFGLAPSNHPKLKPPIYGYAKPNDYQIQFSNSIVDTSSVWPPSSPKFPFTSRIPVSFRIYNVTEGTYIPFLFYNIGSPQPNSITPLDELIFLDKNPRGAYSPSWDILFSTKEGDTLVYTLGNGDTLNLKTDKSFTANDKFEFTTVLPHVNSQTAASSLDNIRVVPNPYVTASTFEPPLPSGITSGRGERKMDFIHLPAQSKITIYTVRGDRIATLYHDSSISDGAVSWNLKTDENLDIAFGVYFYVVESPVGNKTGKIAIIK